MGAEADHALALDTEITCLSCGYDLRGTVSERCPECGREFDRAALAASQIPWVHRRQIGRLRAYWKTVGMVVFRPLRLYAEINRPVRYRDAQSFRWITVLHVWAAYSVIISLLLVADVLDPLKETLGAEGGMKVVWGCLTYACPLLFLALASGAQSYFFHPANLSVERQNRAITLSYYGAAHWAIIAVLAPLGLALLMAEDLWWPDWQVIPAGVGKLVVFLGIAATTSVGVLLVLWFGNLLYFAAGVAEAGWARIAVAGTCLLLLYLASAVVTMAVLPAGVIYLAWIGAAFI